LLPVGPVCKRKSVLASCCGCIIIGDKAACRGLWPVIGVSWMPRLNSCPFLTWGELGSQINVPGGPLVGLWPSCSPKSQEGHGKKPREQNRQGPLVLSARGQVTQVAPKCRLVMVEGKCIQVDLKQAALARDAPPGSPPKLNHEQWQALIVVILVLHQYLLRGLEPRARVRAIARRDFKSGGGLPQ
jgi:hypothetical protein